MSKKLVGAAAIIMDSEGRILLVKHSYGKYNWELPSGLSEQNESAEVTHLFHIIGPRRWFE
ncbi:hypothetical protein BK133_08150 [Paenibacillus sp. FSL H8-0548]|uniref:NUDIX hydrolase n=1 Tax=Paenibacillus sp. FSL H8-0548 TaxID=1920422 RepID=UPI00096DDA2C|nr:NUDIX domain-containing protein [Paenibacillus sp. FSL H8-0548]OMF36882.1 hypothetical protein BK133_08150 [Paenibacillus sp. FSL H8-0548]